MGEIMEKIKKSKTMVIKFGKLIDKEELVRIFGRVNNRFKIWGNPMRLGPNKIHIYGVDKHSWKSIWLELTDEHLVAVMFDDDCMDVFYRLVCNIQRDIDASAKAFVGGKEMIRTRCWK